MKLYAIESKGHFESTIKMSKYKFITSQRNNRSAIFREKHFKSSKNFTFKVFLLA